MSDQPPPYPPPSDPNGYNGYGYQPQSGSGGGPGSYPQAPYPQAGYPGSPYGQMPRKSHTTRNVLLIVVVVVVLVCGGSIAAVALLVHKAKDAFDDQTNYPGGQDNPLTVTVGKAFSIHGTDYAAGWTVTKDSVGEGEIDNLVAKNNRPNKSSRDVSLDIKFLKGSSILAEIDCSSGGTDIGYGQTKTLSCYSSDKLPTGYDTVTVNDSYGDYDY